MMKTSWFGQTSGMNPTVTPTLRLMGGWKLETGRFALMVTFPVAAFWFFNQPSLFKVFMKGYKVPDSREGDAAIAQFKEQLLAQKRKDEKLMYRRGLISDDEDDDAHPSEATMHFSAKLTAEFRKAFPLRSESNLRKPTPIATPSLTQISKRLNFDDSFNTSSGELSFRNGKQHVDQLQQEILNLRKELIRQSHSVEIENVRTELNKVLHSRDEWHEASTRFHRYFKCAKARLMVAESELRRRGLLKGNVKTALTSAWTSTEDNIQDIQGNLCDLLRDASTTLEELDKEMNDERDDVREYMKSLTQKSASSNGDEDDDSSTNDTAMIFEGSVENAELEAPFATTRIVSPLTREMKLKLFILRNNTIPVCCGCI
ncbi:hypothetical protein COOONC_27861 [Cooperia oncophora]